MKQENNLQHSSGTADFKTLCHLLSGVQKVMLADGSRINFDFSDRGRLARVILSQKLSKEDSESIAISLIARSGEESYSNMSVSDWCAYIITSARNLKKALEEERHEKEKKFKAFLAGQDIDLTDSEFIELSEYKKHTNSNVNTR